MENVKNYHARGKNWKQFRYETLDHSDIILMNREIMKCHSGLPRTGILQFTQVLQVNEEIREIMKNKKKVRNRAYWPGQRRPKMYKVHEYILPFLCQKCFSSRYGAIYRD